MKVIRNAFVIIFLILTVSLGKVLANTAQNNKNLKIQFSNIPLKVDSFGPSLRFEFADITQINVLNQPEEIKPDFQFSTIFIVDGKEYYISKASGLKIMDNEKQYDTSDLEESIGHQDDETRFFNILSKILPDFTFETRGLDIVVINFAQSCDDCWVDSYCKKNCPDRRWSCSWSRGCEKISLADQTCDDCSYDRFCKLNCGGYKYKCKTVEGSEKKKCVKDEEIVTENLSHDEL